MDEKTMLVPGLGNPYRSTLLYRADFCRFKIEVESFVGNFLVLG